MYLFRSFAAIEHEIPIDGYSMHHQLSYRSVPFIRSLFDIDCIAASTLLPRNLCGYWFVKCSLYRFIGHCAYGSFASISRPLQVSWIFGSLATYHRFVFVRQLLVTVTVRATFRFRDTTPQGKYYIMIMSDVILYDFKTEGRMPNRFGKVRLNLQSVTSWCLWIERMWKLLIHLWLAFFHRSTHLASFFAAIITVSLVWLHF